MRPWYPYMHGVRLGGGTTTFADRREEPGAGFWSMEAAEGPHVQGSFPGFIPVAPPEQVLCKDGRHRGEALQGPCPAEVPFIPGQRRTLPPERRGAVMGPLVICVSHGSLAFPGPST